MDDDQDEYDDIADEDLIGAFSQPSQSLPQLPSSPRPQKRQRRSQDSIESSNSGNEEDDKKKKKKYRIHIAEKDVPAAKIVGATQAEALPSSSPWRIRGPIYIKPRPAPPLKPVFSTPPKRIPSANSSKTRTSNLLQDDPVQRRNNTLSPNHDYSRELDDLPSDAFSSPENDAASKEPTFIGSSPARGTRGGDFRSQRVVAPQQGLRQTTLFGGRAADEAPASQTKKAFNFRMDKPPEVPTQHALDQEALKTWVYPTNLGSIRDYQFSIVKHGLFNNLLVALPTGLGKTFIAATIMYNFFRWTKDAQIVFVAPTKPLVAQQVKACFNIVGIPRSQTTMLTGEQLPALRAEEWNEKRVFFMTPQTLHNDLTSGIANPKRIALLVVDEAHRATGKYAYCTVVTFLRRFNQSFRVLALTATPGASVEAIQEVINNLEISKVEIRTEESIDIQQYVHRRNIDQVIIDPSDEIIMIKELFSKALQPLVNQLCAQNAYYNKDPMSLTTFGLLQARTKWMADAGRNANMGLKGMMIALFAILSSLAHSIKLLNFHGIGPFYQVINAFRTEVEDGRKPSKYKSQVIQSPEFVKMMDRIRLWLSKDDFVGHPKLTYLCDTVLNHFLDAGEGRLGEDAPPSSTRVIVFAEYRDSAEEISRVLNKHGPMVRSSVFVGQADSKRSEGMSQSKQQETINAFKAGKFNVLVATSIGEEGLDIGQVDLIVCFDASGSPIRMLQRMGRTGRKRAGHIVLLLMRGKEEDAFAKAKDNYEQMQKMISSGERFEFRHDLSVRIVPREVTPVVDKRTIEIPFENTQDPERLPEPKRRATKGKKPAKKFHMPDDVETGFRKASKLTERGGPIGHSGITVKRKQNEAPKNILAPLLSPESVFLNSAEEREFMDRYINVCGNESQEVSVPDICSHPSAQRSLGPAVNVPHGQHTLKSVTLFRTLANSQNAEDRYIKPFGDVEPSRSFWDPPCLVEGQVKASKTPVRLGKSGLAKKQPPPKAATVLSDIESDGDDSDPTSSVRRAHRLRDGFSSDSEGAGDIIHSEDRSEDDSDLGSLRDFLADGTQLSSSARRPGWRGSSTTPPQLEQTPKPFFIPTQFANTQDEDDDMPDLQTLMGKKAELASKLSVRSYSDEEEDVPFQAQQGKRRRLVVDSDSDE
ncbi:putative ATP-dependent DNA helicase mph1 [Diplocarpon rosae]|nr:putative ATP-dependent DNA helicase mph1 [Diplocarpon rosae]